MRKLPIAFGVVALVFSLLPGVSGGYGSMTFCPPYDLHYAVGETRIDATSHEQEPAGAFVLSYEGYYFFEDTAVVNSLGQEYIYSFALYEESGALPSYQRYDWVCDSCPDDTGWLCDITILY